MKRLLCWLLGHPAARQLNLHYRPFFRDGFYGSSHTDSNGWYHGWTIMTCTRCERAVDFGELA